MIIIENILLILLVALISIPLTYLVKKFYKANSSSTIFAPFDIFVFGLFYLPQLPKTKETYKFSNFNRFFYLIEMIKVAWRYNYCFFRTKKNIIIEGKKVTRFDSIKFIMITDSSPVDENYSQYTKYTVEGIVIGMTNENHLVVIDINTGKTPCYPINAIKNKYFLELNHEKICNC